MAKVQFVSPFFDELDVVALGISVKRNDVIDVSDEDADLLTRSSAFARFDGDATQSANALPADAPEAIPQPTSDSSGDHSVEH